MQPEPIFGAPWHAQVFAMTVALNEDGRFDWPEWSARFGAVLAREQYRGIVEGTDDYYIAWLSALEALVIENGWADADMITDLRSAWRAAYLSTPHGKPVQLDVDVRTD